MCACMHVCSSYGREFGICWQSSSSSTAIPVSDQLQPLSDWFLWTTFTTLWVTHRSKTCLAQLLPTKGRSTLQLGSVTGARRQRWSEQTTLKWRTERRKNSRALSQVPHLHGSLVDTGEDSGAPRRPAQVMDCFLQSQERGYSTKGLTVSMVAFLLLSRIILFLGS